MKRQKKRQKKRQQLAHKMETKDYPSLREGLLIVGSDSQAVGTVHEVFRHVGEVETFGAAGVLPTEAGFDPVQYMYSDGAPGSGDSYFTARPDGDLVLYIPFSAIHLIEGDRVALAVEAADVYAMGWTVRPDVLAGIENEYPTDTGAEPKVA